MGKANERVYVGEMGTKVVEDGPDSVDIEEDRECV